MTIIPKQSPFEDMEGYPQVQNLGNNLSTATPSALQQKNWSKSLLLKGISPQELDWLESFLHTEHFSAGATIISEGAVGETLFFIDKGVVQIEKGGIKLAQKKAGTHFGAMALMDDAPRSADVIALSDTVLRTLSISDLKSIEKADIYQQVLTNHIKEQQSLLRNMNNVAIKEVKAKLASAQKRVRAAHFFTTIIFGLVLYQYFLGIFISFSDLLNNVVAIHRISLVMVLLMGLFAVVTIRRIGLPLTHYGWNLHNWKKNLIDSLLWTTVFLTFLTLAKWFATLYVPAFQGQPVFVTNHFGTLDTNRLILSILSYLISAPLQEFIARGVLQTTLKDIAVGKWRVLKVIVFSNLIFGALHVHFDIKFALMTIIPGLFWGFLFEQQKSLFGVSVSHFIIGMYVFGWMGLL